MKKYIVLLAVVAIVLSSMPVFGASVSDAELNALKAQMREMQAKIEKLESGSTEHVSQETVNNLVAEAMTKQEGVPEWLSKIFGFEGEMSYEHQNVDDKKSTQDYHKNNLKGLLTIYGKVNSETDLVMRLRADTVQGNSDKNVDMELLYVDYHPDSINKLPFIGTGIDLLSGVTPFYDPGVVEGTHLLGGIVPYPFYHPVNVNIAFDGPELDGFTGIFKKDLGDNVKMFATTGGFWINEDDDGPDTGLWGGQAGLTYLVPGMDDTYATMAVGYFDYSNVEGVMSADTSNTVDADGNYTNDFDLLVANGEISFPLCDGVPVLCDYPVTLFGEYANNVAATTNSDTAYSFGLSVGEISNVGMWQFVYNYRDVEKDAALDRHNAGFGDATDVTGHAFELGYRLAENISFTAGYLAGKQDVSTSSKENYDEVTFKIGFAF